MTYYTPSWASAFLKRLARAAVRVPEAKSRSNMVINVIKVVVNIFLPYLGLIVFITITYLYKKGGLLSKIHQNRRKKFADYPIGDYPNWDNIPNYE